MKRISLPLRYAAAFIGAIIGAGFATGREVYQYFTINGRASLWGILLASALFCVVSYALYRIRDSHTLFGRFGSLYRIILCSGLLIVIAGMLAGSEALFSDVFSMPGFLGAVATAGICILAVAAGANWVVNLNAVLVPFLVAFMIYIYVTLCLPVAGNMGSASVNALVYYAYNIPLAAPLLMSVAALMSRKQAIVAAVFGSVAVGIMLLCVDAVLKTGMPQVADEQLPLLYLLGDRQGMRLMYGISVWLGIITTLVAALFSLADSFPKWDRGVTASAGCAAGYFLALLGFSRIVAICYPLIGIAGLFLTVCLVIYGIRKVKKNAVNGIRGLRAGGSGGPGA